MVTHERHNMVLGISGVRGVRHVPSRPSPRGIQDHSRIQDHIQDQLREVLLKQPEVPLKQQEVPLKQQAQEPLQYQSHRDMLRGHSPIQGPTRGHHANAH